MKKITFILGGCRSGKSRYALELAKDIPGKKKVFIATCVPLDEEMKQRVKRHQTDRGPDWSTIEIPIHLPQAVTDNSSDADVIVIDCLTLWLNNLFGENSAVYGTKIILLSMCYRKRYRDKCG